MSYWHKHPFPKELDAEICNLILAVEQCDKRVTGANLESDSQDNSTGNIVDMNISNWVVDEEYPIHRFENLGDAKIALDQLIIKIDKDKEKPFIKCQYGPQIKRKLIALSAHMGLLTKPRSECTGEKIGKYIGQVNGFEFPPSDHYFAAENSKLAALESEIVSLQKELNIETNLNDAMGEAVELDAQQSIKENLIDPLSDVQKALSESLEKMLGVNLPEIIHSETPETDQYTYYLDRLEGDNNELYAAYITGKDRHFQIALSPRDKYGKAVSFRAHTHEVIGHATHMASLHQKIQNGEIPKCLGLTTVIDPFCPVMEAVAYFAETLLLHDESISQMDENTRKMYKLRTLISSHVPHLRSIMLQQVIEGKEPADIVSQWKDDVIFYSNHEKGSLSEEEKRAKTKKLMRSIYSHDAPALRSKDDNAAITDRQRLSYGPVYSVIIPTVQNLFKKLYLDGNEQDREKFAGFLRKLYTEYHDYVDFTRLVKGMGCKECLVAEAHDTAKMPFIVKGANHGNIERG